jgi:hypothetical protein
VCSFIVLYPLCVLCPKLPVFSNILIPRHLSSPPVLSRVLATRCLVLSVCFMDLCLSFWPLSFGHCDVCSSTIYGFWLLLLTDRRNYYLLHRTSSYENRCVGDIRLTDSRVLIFLTGISQIHFLVVTVHVLYLNFHPSATVTLSNSTQSFLAVLSEKAYCYVFVRTHMSPLFLEQIMTSEAAYRYTHYWYSRWVNNSNWTDRNSHIKKENK